MKTALDYKQPQNKQNNKLTHENKISQTMSFKQSIKCRQQAYSIKNRLFVLIENSHKEAIFKQSIPTEGSDRSWPQGLRSHQ